MTKGTALGCRALLQLARSVNAEYDVFKLIAVVVGENAASQGLEHARHVWG